jgi:DNA polymerase III delta subunit
MMSAPTEGGPTAPIGYYWGEDSYGVSRGPDALARRIEAKGEAVERVRLSGSSTSAQAILERVGTATMFGGGTLVVVAEPGPLIATKPLAAQLVEVFASIALGNGLAFLDAVDVSNSFKRPASLETLKKAVEAAGGEVRRFDAPSQDGMARWIGDRAAERGIQITPQAARVLAERIGAYVREKDVDRRRQGELAVSELEKLAVYRLDAPIGPDDVKALVAEAVPGSTWAFLDAIGARRAGEAADLAERLDDMPAPVLVVHLHRRLKDLVDVADLLSVGTPAAALVRTLKLNPWRAERLAEQARRWTLPELDAALAGLLELDAALKGHDGGDVRRRSAVCLWIAEFVRKPGSS